MRAAPTDGWILAGSLDGQRPEPALDAMIGGVPHLVRTACEMALAGVKHVTVVWVGDAPAPDVDALARDPRLASRATLALVPAAALPAGDAPVLVVRADRVFHRDTPKAAITAWKTHDAARLAKVEGDESDGVLVADAATARTLVAAAARARGLDEELATLAASGEVVTGDRPYLGFTVSARTPRELGRAERKLVWSLRKSADGIAAKLLNRRISLPFSWLLSRTPVHPNHVTIVAFLCAVAGGIIIGQGGYAAGVAGMLFVELGSIVDGIDGELARLRFQFSKTGQWLDTLADDFGNVAYWTGVAINLADGGASWSIPLAATTIVAFAITQSTQYYLITRVYHSGDLAAIPWAFQSSEFLSRRSTGLKAFLADNAPKLLKRDFAITLFVVCALLGHLELVLLISSGGALTFFAVFWFQYVRQGRAHVRATLGRARSAS